MVAKTCQGCSCSCWTIITVYSLKSHIIVWSFLKSSYLVYWPSLNWKFCFLTLQTIHSEEKYIHSYTILESKELHKTGYEVKFLMRSAPLTFFSDYRWGRRSYHVEEIISQREIQNKLFAKKSRSNAVLSLSYPFFPGQRDQKVLATFC